MLEIKILGTGCAGCRKMEDAVIAALKEMDITDATVERVDEERMIDYGLSGDNVPGLLINGNLAWAGSVASIASIKAWIQEAIELAVPGI